VKDDIPKVTSFILDQAMVLRQRLGSKYLLAGLGLTEDSLSRLPNDSFAARSYHGFRGVIGALGEPQSSIE
jgi:hypothetical protein